MIELPNYKTYFGGKQASGVYQTIINHIPKHVIYVEPFLGRGTIMRLKRPAPLWNIGIDKDLDLCNEWAAAANDSRFIIYNTCGIEFLESMSDSTKIAGMSGSDVFVYLDPPYLLNTRLSPKKQYKHELTEADHIRLLQAAVNCKYNVAISCYDNDLYSRMLPGWRKINFKSQTRRGQATETLYMNYPEPTELHDYSFLGRNFRERERIKQKVKRHVNRLNQLPVHERNAIINAISEKVSGHNTIFNDWRHG